MNSSRLQTTGKELSDSWTTSSSLATLPVEHLIHKCSWKGVASLPLSQSVTHRKSSDSTQTELLQNILLLISMHAVSLCPSKPSQSLAQEPEMRFSSQTLMRLRRKTGQMTRCVWVEEVCRAWHCQAALQKHCHHRGRLKAARSAAPLRSYRCETTSIIKANNQWVVCWTSCKWGPQPISREQSCWVTDHLGWWLLQVRMKRKETNCILKCLRQVAISIQFSLIKLALWIMLTNKRI